MSEPPDAARPPAPGGESRVYFPELDGLRFVAFLLVYTFHGGLPQLSGWLGLGLSLTIDPILEHFGVRPTFPTAIRPTQNGWVGVQLFFVLSGFLIATLLLREEARFGRIDLRAFWARRILRIWPLYYLLVAVGFFAVPACIGTLGTPEHRRMVAEYLPSFLLFLGNWSMGLRGPVPIEPLSVLWSVCVEEQFYLVCPLLLAWVAPRLRIPLVLALMASGFLGRYATARAWHNDVLFSYSTVTQLDTFFSGVLLALVLDRWPTAAARAGARLPRWLQATLWAAVFWVLTRPNLGYGAPWRRAWQYAAIWACCLGVVALAVLHRGRWQRLLSRRPIVWLGRISYGLYMYHELALFTSRRLGHGSMHGLLAGGDLATALTFAATVGLAAASYYGYERHFLRLKRRWTRVPSRPV